MGHGGEGRLKWGVRPNTMGWLQNAVANDNTMFYKYYGKYLNPKIAPKVTNRTGYVLSVLAGAATTAAVLFYATPQRPMPVSFNEEWKTAAETTYTDQQHSNPLSSEMEPIAPKVFEKPEGVVSNVLVNQAINEGYTDGKLLAVLKNDMNRFTEQDLTLEGEAAEEEDPAIMKAKYPILDEAVVQEFIDEED